MSEVSECGNAGGPGIAPALERRVGALVGLLAGALALVGGGVLALLAALTVISITGRAFVQWGLGPIPGDYELVEAGVAFAVFAFLPWCQYRRGHVTVDIFVARLGPRGLAVLALIGNLVLTLAAFVIAWRLTAGMQDKLAYGETTFILQFPLWWGYAAAMTGAWLFVPVCAYTVWRSLNEALGAGEPPTVPKGPE